MFRYNWLFYSSIFYHFNILFSSYSRPCPNLSYKVFLCHELLCLYTLYNLTRLFLIELFGKLYFPSSWSMQKVVLATLVRRFYCLLARSSYVEFIVDTLIMQRIYLNWPELGYDVAHIRKCISNSPIWNHLHLELMWSNRDPILDLLRLNNALEL